MASCTCHVPCGTKRLRLERIVRRRKLTKNLLYALAVNGDYLVEKFIVDFQLSSAQFTLNPSFACVSSKLH